MTCNCMGPQGGQPLCPCAMKAARGYFVGNIALGPQYTAAWPQAPTGELIDLLAKAKKHVMTPKEIYDQKVSFIHGQLMDCAPDVTVAEVKRHLMQMGVVDPDVLALPLCENCGCRVPDGCGGLFEKDGKVCLRVKLREQSSGDAHD